MEAVTSILGDELHVGILLQGKKVRDDSKTLIQTGISQDDKHHRLGFMLEPRHNQISSLTTSSHRDISRHLFNQVFIYILLSVFLVLLPMVSSLIFPLCENLVVLSAVFYLIVFL